MIITFLDDLKDHRRAQGKRYELRFVVLFSIMAYLSNAKSYRDIERFINSHFDTLKKDFALEWKEPPGYTTIRNILLGVDQDELESCFRAYTQSMLAENKTNTLIAIAMDGKVLRGSFDNLQDKRAIQIVSMFETDSKIILAHEVISEKTNEIPVIQMLLKDIELEDYCYTTDALHCQKKLLMPPKKEIKI